MLKFISTFCSVFLAPDLFSMFTCLFCESACPISVVSIQFVSAVAV